MAPEKILYASNQKSRGKVHRVTGHTARQPRDQYRVLCGWHITKSTSLVYYSPRMKYGVLCRKCFPCGLADLKNEDKETIDEFPDEQRQVTAVT